MHSHKFIWAIAILILIMSITITWEKRSAFSSVNLERSRFATSATLGRQAIVLAENEQNTTENQSQAATDKESQTPEPVEETFEGRRNILPDEKKKSLKPFVPSEEIAAEQAVDFPVDM